MQYEVVREIRNQCPNNQMRDVFFDEVETDDPEGYVRSCLKGETVTLCTRKGQDGTVTVHANCDDLIQVFIFTPL